MQIRAIIMAGGSGTRFWPLSRVRRPKQFLPIISEKTMIEETVLRLQPEIAPDSVYTIAGADHTRIIAEMVPDIPRENLLVEPQGRNTAPSLMLATAVIYRENPEDVVIALPADHLISKPEIFRKKLMAAALAAESSRRIITFGIPPAFPSTGYGYIRFSKTEINSIKGEKFFAVREFKEKPDLIRAREFLKAGTYYWNSGMFLWRAGAFAEKLEKYAPDLFPFWEEMLAALDSRKGGLLEDIFSRIPSISIDYALMERAEGIAMCEGDFGWSDVGAWSSLDEIWEKDLARIAARGETLALDSEDCLVFNPGKLTTLIGVKDLIVVDTDDVLLICRKDLDQQVKSAVEALKKKADPDRL